MYIKDKGLIFIHFPRTGGSTIETVFGQKIEETWRPSLMRKLIPDDEWIQSFKFGIVRNPFDRLVSEFLYFGSEPRVNTSNYVVRGESFSSFVHRLNGRCEASGMKPMQMKDWYHNIADEVLRFEEYATVVPPLLARFGYEGELPHINASVGRLPYPDYYDEETKNMVQWMYSTDLEYWGYEF